MEEDQKNVHRQTHVAVMPSPGIGHLTPLASLAKHLVADHGVEVTFIVVSARPLTAVQKTYLDALPAHINSVLIPTVDLRDLPESSNIETIIYETIFRSLPAVADVLRLRGPPAALVVDLFGTPAFALARQLGVRPYIFFTSTATFLSLFLHLPELDKTSEAEFRDWPDKIRLPGCVPLNGSDLIDPLQNRKAEDYSMMLRVRSWFAEADGILVNTFVDLEPGPLAALGSVKHFPPVYPVGPLVYSGTDATGAKCLNWLDQQPADSVVFVSFGSGGTLSAVQTAELAAGLELSGQRFLWVVRETSDTDSSKAYFSENSTTGDDLLAHLPDGFLNRTGGVGLAVPRWAPQMKVLEHPSTGGFLTHCGWNSVLESLVNGVPMIAWPLYSEQKMNAVMLEEETGVALRPVTAVGTVVGREEVARVVRELMEGEAGNRVRRRVRELMECGAKTLAPGGSSYKNLSQLVNAWTD